MSRSGDLRLSGWMSQMADGLDAGMSPGNALALSKGLGSEETEGLLAVFERGGNWDEALGNVALPLDDSERAILRAAESSGSLPKAFRKLSKGREERAKVKRRMMMSLLYPLFLLHFAAVVFSISYLVDGRTAAFFVSAGMVISPVWAVGLMLAMLAKVSPEALRSLSRAIPFFAGYRRNWDLGTLCEVLAVSLGAGMRIDAAWEVAAEAANNPRLRTLEAAVQEKISSGQPASDGIEASGLRLPQSFLQLYRSGETTGSLERNLEAAAQRYQTDGRNSLFLATTIYPKLILAGIVGYAGYKIVLFFQNYYEELMNITA